MCSYNCVNTHLLLNDIVELSSGCSFLQILAGILHLGNVSFSSLTDESQPCHLVEQCEGMRHYFYYIIISLESCTLR